MIHQPLPKFGLIATASFWLLSTGIAAASPQNLQTNAKFGLILRDREAIGVAALYRPENADLLQMLKSEAEESRSSLAIPILIWADDQETINACLSAYHAEIQSDDPQRYEIAADQLRVAANPKLIRTLATDLMQEESLDTLNFGDVGVFPRSVTAALIIQRTLQRCPLFSLAVRKWAGSILDVPDEAREPMRAWWKQNKTVIEQGNYQAAVIPPSS